MKILVDIRHLMTPQQSGVGEYTIQLLRALFEIDKTNEYILFSSGLPDRRADRHSDRRSTSNWPTFNLGHINEEQITFVHLPIPNKLLNLRTLLLQHPTLNWHVREPVDLIFLPNLNIVSLPPDIPTILTIHDLSWHFFPEFYSRKMQLWHKATRPTELITKATRLITPSQSTKQDVVTAFHKPDTNIAVIPHGIDPIFSPTMEARDHGVRSRLKLPKRFALFVGTMEPRKNLLGLLEGMKRYRERSHDDLHLVLAGKWGWKSNELKRELKKKEMRGWVHHLGYIPKEDRPALYRSATVLTWPSIYEGFGLPVLEAMASGTPVITSHTSSMPELTHDAGILIDPYNINDIADALRGLIGSNTLQKQLRDRGLARASQFSWQRSAMETKNLFEQWIS